MEVIHERCAGLDVHQETAVACVRVVEGGKVSREVRTFRTTTKDLLAMSDWLKQRGCTHVAMESTGVYWKPVWHVLEGQFELVLANAAQVRNLPGRKSDVKDAEWVADLLAHGLIRGSFVPPTSIQELRDLTRTRTQLVREVSRHTLRVQKTLEDANIKLTGLISNVLGVSGRAILEALIAGETSPEGLLKLKHGNLKTTREELLDALQGRVRDHHRFLLKLHLEQIDALKEGVAKLEARIGRMLEPFREELDLFMSHPGISQTSARIVSTEIGLDMSRFFASGHLVSWAGLCPRSDESAGKRRSTRIRAGNPWLKTALIQAAWAAIRARTPTRATSTCACAPAAGQRKPSSPSLPPSLPTSTSSSSDAYPTKTSAPITSTKPNAKRSPTNSFDDSKTSASKSKSKMQRERQFLSRRPAGSLAQGASNSKAEPPVDGQADIALIRRGEGEAVVGRQHDGGIHRQHGEPDAHTGRVGPMRIGRGDVAKGAGADREHEKPRLQPRRDLPALASRHERVACQQVAVDGDGERPQGFERRPRP